MRIRSALLNLELHVSINAKEIPVKEHFEKFLKQQILCEFGSSPDRDAVRTEILASLREAAASEISSPRPPGAGEKHRRVTCPRNSVFWVHRASPPAARYERVPEKLVQTMESSARPGSADSFAQIASSVRARHRGSVSLRPAEPSAPIT